MKAAGALLIPSWIVSWYFKSPDLIQLPISLRNCGCRSPNADTTNPLKVATKAIGGVGVLIGGLLLDNFVDLQAGQANKEIAEEVIFRLAIADAVIVNACILIPAISISRYNLQSERVAVIQQELAVGAVVGAIEAARRHRMLTLHYTGRISASHTRTVVTCTFLRLWWLMAGFASCLVAGMINFS